MSARMALLWHRAGEAVLLFMAFILPLGFYLKTYDSVTIKTATLQLGTLALVLAWILKGIERGRWEAPKAAWPMLVPALFLLAWTGLRFAVSEFRLAALPGFLNQVLFIAAFCVALLEYGGADAARRLTGWTLAAAWIACLYALVQKLGLDPFIWKGAFGDRVFSTLADPDLLGQFLALCFPLAAAGMSDLENGLVRPVADFVLMLLCCLAIYWTGSAQALLALALQGVVFAVVVAALIADSRARVAGLLASVLALGTVAAAFNFSPKAERSLLYEGAFKTRAWAGTWDLIRERPWTGQGPGSYALHFPRHRPPALIRLEGGHNTMTEHPESLILELAAESGLVGAFLWLALFGSVLAGAWRAAGRFQEQGALDAAAYTVGLSAALLGALLSSQFCLGGTFIVPGWLIWPLAGILGGLSLLASPGPVTVLPLPWSEGTRRLLYGPACALALVLGAFPLLWFLSDVRHNQGVYHAKRKNWDQALAEWASVRPGAPAYIMAAYFKGHVYLDWGKPEDALRQYAVVESLAPDYVQVHFQKGIARLKFWDWAGAEGDFERAARLDPDFAPAHRRLSEAALAAGHLERARRAALTAVSLEPREEANRQALAAVYIKEKRTAEARRVLRDGERLRAGKRPARDGKTLH